MDNNIEEITKEIDKLNNSILERISRIETSINEHIDFNPTVDIESIGGIIPTKEYEYFLKQLDEAMEKVEEMEKIGKVNEIIKLPKTCYPHELVSATAKVNNLLFNGKLSKELQSIFTESRGRKELTVKASIDFEELKGIKLSDENITQYDKEVHDSIVSLVVDGENKYITPLMVYRTMTGNPKAKLSKKNFNDIVNSIEKLSKIRVYIDATGEIKGRGYNLEQPIFKENLIYTRGVSGIYNGKVSEWIEILEIPVLYRYANSKNQVARMDIFLLNTPINKNEENIRLQGYIRDRIQAMKGSKLSKNIVYETVYKQLNINNKTYKRLRDKQSKIRNTIKEILDYWVEKDFIKGYEENPKNQNSKVSITILL